MQAAMGLITGPRSGGGGGEAAEAAVVRGPRRGRVGGWRISHLLEPSWSRVRSPRLAEQQPQRLDSG